MSFCNDRRRSNTDGYHFGELIFAGRYPHCLPKTGIMPLGGIKTLPNARMLTTPYRIIPMEPELDPTHKLVGLCLNIPAAAITTLVDWQKQCPDHDKIDPADVLRHPAVQSYLPDTMPELGLTPDEERSTYLSDFLLFMNPNERAWLMSLRATDWQHVDPGREAHEIFHDGFIHRIPGRVMFALVKASMLLQGCEPPADLNRKMNGARSMVEKIQRQTRSHTLSPNVPPIHRPETPGCQGGAQ